MSVSVDTIIRFFEKCGHKLSAVEKEKALTGDSMYIYKSCEKCNVSLYNWSQCGMGNCSK